MAFSAACFGSIPIAVTIATRSGLPLVATLAWRYGLGTLLLLAAAWPARGRIFVRGGWLPSVVLGAWQAAVAIVSLSALRYIPAATLSFLFYTYPGWIAVIGAVRGTEPFTTARVAALGIALVGIAIMVGAPSAADVHAGGVALALLSAVLYATYVPTVEHFAQRHGGPVAATFAASGAAVAFVVGALLWPGASGGLHLPRGIPAWAAVSSLALFSTALGFLAFLRGLAVVGPGRAAIVSTIEPFVTAVLAAALLGQPLTVGTFAGGLCVAAAVVVLQRSHATGATTTPMGAADG